MCGVRGQSYRRREQEDVMRRFRMALAAAGFLLAVSACSARMERALELTWDDATATPRDQGGSQVIRVGPIL
jgi:hypothetical protein